MNENAPVNYNEQRDSLDQTPFSKNYYTNANKESKIVSDSPNPIQALEAPDKLFINYSVELNAGTKKVDWYAEPFSIDITATKSYLEQPTELFLGSKLGYRLSSAEGKAVFAASSGDFRIYCVEYSEQSADPIISTYYQKVMGKPEFDEFEKYSKNLAAIDETRSQMGEQKPLALNAILRLEKSARVIKLNLYLGKTTKEASSVPRPLMNGIIGTPSLPRTGKEVKF